MQLSHLYNHRGVPHDRYVVVGTSGSGKSTLADKIAWRTGNRHIELDAHVLLLGVGHECNTSLHLAEYRWSGAASRRTTVSAPMMVGGERRWVDYEDIDHDESDFGAIGEAFEQTHDVHVGRVGEAEARLVSQPQMVDFSLRWMETERS